MNDYFLSSELDLKDLVKVLLFLKQNEKLCVKPLECKKKRKKEVYIVPSFLVHIFLSRHSKFFLKFFSLLL